MRLSNMICAICGTDISKTTDPFTVVEFVTERRPIKGEVVKEMHNSAKNIYCSQKCLFEQVSKGIEEL